MQFFICNIALQTKNCLLYNVHNDYAEIDKK